MEQEASELMRGLSSTVDSKATIESLKGLMALIERADGATAEELAAALRRHGAVQRLCALVDDAAPSVHRRSMAILGNLVADALVTKCNRLADKIGEFVSHGAQAHGGDAFALGSAEVGVEDNPGALVDHGLEGGEGGSDSCVVVDHHRAGLFGHRHVVVHACKYAFALQIQIVDCEFSHSFPQKGAESYRYRIECQWLCP